jgi:hypothetical protein
VRAEAFEFEHELDASTRGKFNDMCEVGNSNKQHTSTCVALSMPHSELSHERKTVTYLDTITFMIMKACPQKRAQQSTPSHWRRQR